MTGVMSASPPKAVMRGPAGHGRLEIHHQLILGPQFLTCTGACGARFEDIVGLSSAWSEAKTQIGRQPRHVFRAPYQAP